VNGIINVTAAVIETPEYDDIDTWNTFTTSGTYAYKWLTGQENGIGAVLYQPAGSGSGGITNTHYALDLDTGVWTQKANYPTGSTSYLSTSTYIDTDENQKLFVAGGFQVDEIDEAHRYNPIDNTWTTLTPMPAARRYMGMAWDRGDYIYVVGGIDSSAVEVDTVWRYSVASDTWDSSLSTMPSNLGYQGMSYYNGHLYTIGGYNGTSNVSTVFKYDVAADSWSTISGAPKTARVISGIQRGSKYWVLGGYTTTYEAVHMMFNMADETFTGYSNLSFTRAAGTAALDLDGNIVIAGGNTALSGANKGTVA